jgi:hypothetical protein
MTVTNVQFLSGVTGVTICELRIIINNIGNLSSNTYGVCKKSIVQRKTSQMTYKNNYVFKYDFICCWLMLACCL